MKRGVFSMIFLFFLAALPTQERKPAIDSIATFHYAQQQKSIMYYYKPKF